MEQFADYRWAIAAIVIYAVIAQLLNALTGIRKGSLELTPGTAPDQDYSNPSYRLDRAYMNTVEVLAFLGLVVVAAILAGVSAAWVNALTTAALAFRICAAFVYLRGIGKPYGGIRTGFMILTSLVVYALAIMTLVAVF